MDTLKNQRIAEYFIISLLIGIGTPVSILWGIGDGESLAAKTHVTKSKSPVQPAASVGMDMFLPTSENIEKGRALFQKNCTACHGEHADGKGPAAIALTPPPRNFTDPAAKWTRSRDPQDIHKTLSEGSPGTAMPSFSASLTEEERWALVHYVGTLPGVQNQFHPIDENLAKTLAAEEKTLMSVLYLLIPVSVLLASGFVVVCLIAIRGGQFDDVESPPWRMLFDGQNRSKTKPERIPS